MKWKWGAIVLVLSALPVVANINGLLFPLGPVLLENVAQAFGLLRITPSFGAATFDMNQDGWPDLLVSGHGTQPRVFINVKGKSFREADDLLPVRNVDRHSPALADFDNDGDQDLFFQIGAHDGTGLGPKEFYLNPGKGKPFVRVSMPVLEDPKGRGRTAVWFDYDHDGFVDLLEVDKLRTDAPNRLFHNNGDRSFTDVSATSGLSIAINSEGGAVAADFDNDGDQDILYDNTDERPYLFMNQGDGTFRDETFARGIPAVSDTWAAGVADYDNDGFLDIYFSRGNDSAIAEGGVMALHRLNFLQIVHPPEDHMDQLSFLSDPNAVLHFSFSVKRVDLDHLYVGAQGVNPGTLKFDVGPGHISAEGIPSQWRADGSARGTFIWHDAATGVWSVATAGGTELLIAGALVETESNLSSLTFIGMEPSSPKFPDVLLRNRGNGTFADVTASSHTGDTSNSRSPVWVDLDNDGDLDLFVVGAGFNGSGKQPHICYIQENGVFTRYTLDQGPFEQFGRGDGALTADFNKDGRLDLFVVNGSGLLPANRGPYQLYLNRTSNPNHWISFRLVGGGKDYTNHDAIGAKIELHTNESPKRTLWRFINGGSGSDCQSSRVLHFGIAESSGADIVVYWPPSHQFPSGHQQAYVFNSSLLNRNFLIDEIKGIAASESN